MQPAGITPSSNTPVCGSNRGSSGAPRAYPGWRFPGCWPRWAWSRSIRVTPTPGRPPRAVTYIDGEAGILRYRGYPIERLAESSSFLETSYLLIRGELPSPAELDAFTRRIGRHTMLHEDLKHFFDGFPRNADPVSVLSSAVSALSTFHGDALDPFDPEQVELSTVRLLAKVPTIAAYAYRKSVGQPLLYPDNSLGYVENFLRLSFGFPAEPYEQNPTLVRALNRLLILHADDEQNCSTATVRLVGSAHTNLYASISAGINALLGPLHGGAARAVLVMLERIRGDGGDVKAFVERVKNKSTRGPADGIRAPGLQELRPAGGAGQGQRPRGARRPGCPG